MSEFDQIKNDAEKEAQQHPQQVKEGEEDVEKRLGMQGQGQQGQGQQGQGQQGQGQGQQNP